MYQITVEIQGDKKTHNFNIADDLLDKYLKSFEKEEIFWTPDDSYAVYINKQYVVRMDIVKIPDLLKIETPTPEVKKESVL